MLNRVRSLVAVLVLGLPGLAAAQDAKPEDATKTFVKQEKYTYCDVKILADYWKTSAKDAKARAGAKLQAKDTTTLDSELQQGRGKTKVTCTYTDGGFTMKDVKKLSSLWHMTIAEAKATLERKTTGGSAIYMKQEIRGTEDGSVDKDFDAFASQTKYSYCDAKMIGTLWGKSARDGKTAIGAKLNAKKSGPLAKLVTEARKNALQKPEALCTSYDAGFTYDDVVLLAAAWKKDAGEVKAKAIGLEIAKGHEAQVRADLKKAKAAAAKAAKNKSTENTTGKPLPAAPSDHPTPPLVPPPVDRPMTKSNGPTGPADHAVPPPPGKGPPGDPIDESKSATKQPTKQATTKQATPPATKQASPPVPAAPSDHPQTHL